mmetsp:Transcript_102445/g.181950  ORF Transcript_102445/g.181950 Transcript_102445/m.181950 type:complete len:831 (+) Transcript_102445:54-2546(+)
MPPNDVAEEDSGNIKVCVRVRPFASREQGETLCIRMPTSTAVVCSDGKGKPNTFDFDRSYWSHQPKDRTFATQQTLMEELGEKILENARNGYNNCLFAYGQTGSGKTHSVLGMNDPPEMRGLLPRCIEALFQMIDEQHAENREGHSVIYNAQVSYMEIYNEQLRDLLIPVDDRNKQKLDVRQHPKFGTFVPGLSENAVTKEEEVQRMIDFGAKTRSVAATAMNAGSSRSHCIFTFVLERKAKELGKESESRAKVNLVDLAGSERQKKTEAGGDRLKEGAMINQSLTTLAQVINKLAEAGEIAAKGKKVAVGDFVPFRNSKLTHLLQESLAGNSKTVMMAAVSPALSNFEETMSTLRFAQTCKNVKTKAVKNEESKADMLQDLQAELEQLKAMESKPGVLTQEAKVKELENLRQQFMKDFQDSLKEAKEREEVRTQALEDMGLSTDELASAFAMDKNCPQLVNISEDPSLSGALIYFLAENEDTFIGAGKENKIEMKGLSIANWMCALYNQANDKVFLKLMNQEGKPLQEGQTRQGRLLVNGKPPAPERELKHMDRIMFGHAYLFRVVVPLHAEDPGTIKQEAISAGIEDALNDVVNDEDPAFQEVRAVMDTITDRIGPEKVQEFLHVFTEHFPMIEEGNKITSQVRPHDRLRFQLEVCSDIATYTTDEPELVVRLYQEDDAGEEQVLGIVELSDYVERLERLRELYTIFEHEGTADTHWDFGTDPWGFYSYDELQNQLVKLKNKLVQADSNGGAIGVEQVFALSRVTHRFMRKNSGLTYPNSPKNNSPSSPNSPKSPKKRLTHTTSWADSHKGSHHVHRSNSAPSRTWKM